MTKMRTLIWLSSATLILSCAQADIKKSVGEAIKARLPIDQYVVLGAIERALNYPSESGKNDAIIASVRACIKSYANEVVVTKIDDFKVILNELSPSRQESLERELDSALVQICGRREAERVKYLLIKYLYFQTAAFGKYALTISVNDKQLMFSAGPFTYEVRQPMVIEWLPQQFLRIPFIENEKSK